MVKNLKSDMEFIVLHRQKDELYQFRVDKEMLKMMVRQMKKADGIHIYFRDNLIVIHLDKSKWEIHSGKDNAHIYPKEVK